MALPSQKNAPQLSDARGMLIPDDMVRYRDHLKSDPVAFFSSYQFYVKATKNTYLHPKTDRSIAKYLSAIPDHHFRLIKCLCVDFGVYSPDELTRIERCEFYESIIGAILSRGGKDLVIKMQWCTDHGTMEVPFWNMCQERRVCFDNLCGDPPIHLERFKETVRYWGYNADRIKAICIDKWQFRLNSDETSDDASCGTLNEDGIAWNYNLLDEYENEIFKINPSKGFVYNAWQPIIWNGGRRMDEWVAYDLRDHPEFDEELYLGTKHYVPTPTPSPEEVFALLAL